MNYAYLIITSIAFLFTSIGKAQEPKMAPAQDAIGDSASDTKTTIVKFNQILAGIETKSIPLIDATNFDQFIDEADHKSVEVEALKLQHLYPNYYKEGYKYKAIKSYKLDMSEAFHAVVVTILKGEHEMESVLVTYDLNGTILDSKVVAYDEIAEGWARIESKIEQKRLTVNHIKWMDEKEIETIIYRIEDNGKIKPLSEDDLLVEHVIKQLSLDGSKIYRRLLVTKVKPNHPEETIMVIPEFTEGNEDESFFELNCHIVIVNTTSGIITHKYIEKGLTSDALQLSEITIDTAQYLVSNDIRAFGITIFYYANSKGSPYSNKTLSLFVTSGDSLKKILNHFNIMEYSGEWDGFCYGAFTNIKNTLVMSKETSNGYFDMIVKSKITKINTIEDDAGDCESKETLTTSNKTLTFDGNSYN